MYSWSLILGLTFSTFVSHCEADKHEITQDTYKAAVFDKAPLIIYSEERVLSREEALQMIQPFVDQYQERSQEAANQGVDILVFPEYGLYPMGTTRDELEPFLERIPDPGTAWNPCVNPERYNDTDLQHMLSCMARQHGIYVVANIGDYKDCNPKDMTCVGGRRQYNTNVAYDRSGTLVARFHKYNLFFEDRYDSPPTPEHSFFDTPFGRFGTVICFDLLFEEPTLRLLEDYNIDTLLFPTAWMNVLPYFSAVPFHQAYAIGAGVNLLGSNLHAPYARFSGSGIYGFNTTIAFRNDDLSISSDLIIETVQSKPVKTPHQQVTIPGSTTVDFQSEIFGDTYNFLSITDITGTAKVCSDSLCCELQYQRQTEELQEFFALGAFRGRHTKEGVYFLEVCAFLKCSEGPLHQCEDGTIKRSNTHFSYVNLTGSFSTKYVYPMYVTDEVNPSAGMWVYDGRSIVSHDPSRALLSAIAFGRRYDLDDVTHGNASNILGVTVWVTFFFLSSVFL